MDYHRYLLGQLSQFKLPHVSGAPLGKLPKGFALGSLPDTIAPTSGSHAGVSMYPDSACAQALIAVSKRRR